MLFWLTKIVIQVKQLEFLGQDARTTTAPAEMALRYDLPLVPVFAFRQANGQNIKSGV